MKKLTIGIISSILLVAGCSDDKKKNSTPFLSGEQAAEISGSWVSNCRSGEGIIIDGESIYIEETKNYSGGELLVTFDKFSDDQCTMFISQEVYSGVYVIGEIFEVNENLKARDMSETLYEFFGASFTTHPYYFINEDTLYFGSDKGEGGDKPHLDLDIPYSLQL